MRGQLGNPHLSEEESLSGRSLPWGRCRGLGYPAMGRVRGDKPPMPRVVFGCDVAALGARAAGESWTDFSKGCWGLSWGGYFLQLTTTLCGTRSPSRAGRAAHGA